MNTAIVLCNVCFLHRCTTDKMWICLGKYINKTIIEILRVKNIKVHSRTKVNRWIVNVRVKKSIDHFTAVDVKRTIIEKCQRTITAVMRIQEERKGVFSGLPTVQKNAFYLNRVWNVNFYVPVTTRWSGPQLTACQGHLYPEAIRLEHVCGCKRWEQIHIGVRRRRRRMSYVPGETDLWRLIKIVKKNAPNSTKTKS